jgi:hypothetical protein
MYERVVVERHKTMAGSKGRPFHTSTLLQDSCNNGKVRVEGLGNTTEERKHACIG